MRVVLDGMGGDYAPKEIVKGAVEATEYINDEIVIVGPEEEILEELKKCKYKGTQIEVVDAPDMITMEDSPVKAIRRKPNSSLVVGLNMIKDGEGDLFISGGSSSGNRIPHPCSKKGPGSSSLRWLSSHRYPPR